MNLFSNKSIKDFFVKDKGENGAAAVEFALAGSLVIITVISIIEILAISFQFQNFEFNFQTFLLIF